MARWMSAAEVQKHFDEVLTCVVEMQQAVIVECDGIPCAVIVAFEEYEHLKAGQTDEEKG